MHYILVAIAAAIAASAQPPAMSEPKPNGTDPANTELMTATKKVERHRVIQGGIDLRTTVILVTVGGLLIGLFKDGEELIGHTFMIVHVWVCVLAVIATAVALIARSGGLDDSTTGDPLQQTKAELKIMHFITERKKIGYNFALLMIAADVIVIAIAITAK